VDESGDFSDASMSVVVGGLLVRAEAERGGPEALRRQLTAAIPVEYWPLHAAHINLPVWFAILQAGFNADRMPLDPTAAAAIRCLRERCGLDLDSVLGALADGQGPRYATLRDMNRVLRRHQSFEYQRLEEKGRALWAAIARVIQDLAANDQSPERPGVAIFAAGETDFDSFPTSDTTADEDARYRDLLACALERVAAILARLGGRHRVGLHVLGRHVFNTVLGIRAPLLLSDVAALAHPLNARFGPHVRLVPEEVARFDRDVHPALVLADFAANHARRALHDPFCPLAATEDDLRGRIPAALRSGWPHLSHLAGDGLARNWIAWAGGHLPSRPLASLSPSSLRRRWACEQAYEWVPALGGTWN
jgi:hypothetical protein